MLFATDVEYLYDCRTARYGRLYYWWIRTAVTGYVLQFINILHTVMEEWHMTNVYHLSPMVSLKL